MHPSNLFLFVYTKPALWLTSGVGTVFIYYDLVVCSFLCFYFFVFSLVANVSECVNVCVEVEVGGVFCDVILLQFLYSTMSLMQGNVKSWDVYILCMHCYLHAKLNQIAVFFLF